MVYHEFLGVDTLWGCVYVFVVQGEKTKASPEILCFLLVTLDGLEFISYKVINQHRNRDTDNMLFICNMRMCETKCSQCSESQGQ